MYEKERVELLAGGPELLFVSDWSIILSRGQTPLCRRDEAKEGLELRRNWAGRATAETGANYDIAARDVLKTVLTVTSRIRYVVVVVIMPRLKCQEYSGVYSTWSFGFGERVVFQTSKWGREREGEREEEGEEEEEEEEKRAIKSLELEDVVAGETLSDVKRCASICKTGGKRRMWAESIDVMLAWTLLCLILAA